MYNVKTNKRSVREKNSSLRFSCHSVIGMWILKLCKVYEWMYFLCMCVFGCCYIWKEKGEKISPFTAYSFSLHSYWRRKTGKKKIFSLFICIFHYRCTGLKVSNTVMTVEKEGCIFKQSPTGKTIDLHCVSLYYRMSGWGWGCEWLLFSFFFFFFLTFSFFSNSTLHPASLSFFYTSFLSWRSWYSWCCIILRVFLLHLQVLLLLFFSFLFLSPMYGKETSGLAFPWMRVSSLVCCILFSILFYSLGYWMLLLLLLLREERRWVKKRIKVTNWASIASKLLY